MNKNIWMLLLSGLIISSIACNKKPAGEGIAETDKTIAAADHDLKLYETHRKRGDINSAIYALTSLIQRDSAYANFKDTLAMMYYSEGNANACAAVVDEIMITRPDDQKLLELGGVAHQAAGNLMESVAYFEKLYVKTGDLKYRYQVATILLNTGEFQQTIKYADEIIAKSESRTMIVEMPNPRGEVTKISLMAAAYTLRGFAYGSMGKKDEAVASFRKSLDIDPNFELAAEGINDILYRKRK